MRCGLHARSGQKGRAGVDQPPAEIPRPISPGTRFPCREVAVGFRFVFCRPASLRPGWQVHLPGLEEP